MDPIVSLAVIVVGGAAIIAAFVYFASKHKCKYGTVQDDGFQYCEKCHTAREPIKTVEPPCSHPKWDLYKEETITQEKKDLLGDFFENTKSATYAKHTKPKPNIIGKVYVLKCAKCGDIMIRRFGVDDAHKR